MTATGRNRFFRFFFSICYLNNSAISRNRQSHSIKVKKKWENSTWIISHPRKENCTKFLQQAGNEAIILVFCCIRNFFNWLKQQDKISFGYAAQTLFAMRNSIITKVFFFHSSFACFTIGSWNMPKMKIVSLKPKRNKKWKKKTINVQRL